MQLRGAIIAEGGQLARDYRPLFLAVGGDGFFKDGPFVTFTGGRRV